MSRRLLASFLTLTVIVLLVLEVPLGITFASHERDQLTSQLERDAVALSTLVEDSLQDGGPVRTHPLREYAERNGVHVSVVDRAGSTIVDTDPNATDGAVGSLPEVGAALRGKITTGTSHPEGVGALRYVAVPVASAGDVYGAVLVTSPTSKVDERIRRYVVLLLVVAAGALVGASALGLVLARSVSRPMRRLQRAALDLGAGNLDARVGDVGGPPVVRSVSAVFDDMAARLQELVSAQDAFVADASHQLRNPLTALRLRLENVRADAGQEAVDDIDGALDEAAHLSRIVDGLLVLARAGDAAFEHDARADLDALVADRMTAWSPLAEERGVALRAAGGAHVLARATDDRVRQVIDNLLANALDAAPTDSEIVLATGVEGRDVAVHVIDAGAGLTDEERARAFDRFWRSSSTSGELGGSGLGLAIVKRLVSADGGHITLERASTGGVDAVVRYRSAGSER